MARWVIRYKRSVENDLKDDSTFSKIDLIRIRKEIEEQLSYLPFSRTKCKKPMPGLESLYGVNTMVWQLTIEPFRAHYTIDEDGVLVVWVLFVFEKGRKTTKEAMKK